MENSKEIAENKLRIERFDRLIASSKSTLIELEHEMAEIEVKTTDLLMDIEKNPYSIKDEIKILKSELKNITEEQPKDL